MRATDRVGLETLVTSDALTYVPRVARPARPVVTARLRDASTLALYLLAPPSSGRRAVAGYQWAIGTAPGLSDVRAWPDTGRVDLPAFDLSALPRTGATVDDLRRLPAQTIALPPTLPSGWHLSVRAIGGEGAASAAVTSPSVSARPAPQTPTLRRIEDPTTGPTGYFGPNRPLRVEATAPVSSGQVVALDVAVFGASGEAVVPWTFVALAGGAAELAIPEFEAETGAQYRVAVRARDTEPGAFKTSPSVEVAYVYDAQAPALQLDDLALVGTPIQAPGGVLTMAFGDATIGAEGEQTSGFFDLPESAPDAPDAPSQPLGVTLTAMLTASDALSGLDSLGVRLGGSGRDGAPTATLTPDAEESGRYALRSTFAAGQAATLDVFGRDSVFNAREFTIDLPAYANDVLPPGPPVVAARQRSARALAVYLAAPARDDRSVAGYQWALGSSKGDGSFRDFPATGEPDFTFAGAPPSGSVTDLTALPAHVIDLSQADARRLGRCLDQRARRRCGGQCVAAHVGAAGSAAGRVHRRHRAQQRPTDSAQRAQRRLQRRPEFDAAR